jgi:hypothetical protein
MHAFCVEKVYTITWSKRYYISFSLVYPHAIYEHEESQRTDVTEARLILLHTRPSSSSDLHEADEDCTT